MANWLDILASPNNVQGGRFNPFALARGFTKAGRDELDLQHQLMMEQGQAGVAQAGLQKANAQGGVQFRQGFQNQGRYDPQAELYVDSPESLDAATQLLQNRQIGAGGDFTKAQIPHLQAQTGQIQAQTGAIQDERQEKRTLNDWLGMVYGVPSLGGFNAQQSALTNQSNIAAQDVGTETARTRLQGEQRFRNDMRLQGRSDPNLGGFYIDSPEALQASGQMYQNRATQAGINTSQAQLPLIQQQVQGATRENTERDLLNRYLESTIGLGSPGVFDAMRQALLDRSGMAAQGAQTQAVQQQTSQQGQEFAARQQYLPQLAKLSVDLPQSEIRNRDIGGFANLVNSSMFSDNPQRVLQAGAAGGNPIAQAYNSQPQKASPAAAIDQQIRKLRSPAGSAAPGQSGTPSRGASMQQPQQPQAAPAGTSYMPGVPLKGKQTPLTPEAERLMSQSFGQNLKESLSPIGGFLQRQHFFGPSGSAQPQQPAMVAPYNQSPEARAIEQQTLRMELQRQLADLLGTNASPAGRGASASNAANLEQIRQMILQLQQQGR